MTGTVTLSSDQLCHKVGIPAVDEASLGCSVGDLTAEGDGWVNWSGLATGLQEFGNQPALRLKAAP